MLLPEMRMVDPPAAAFSATALFAIVERSMLTVVLATERLTALPPLPEMIDLVTLTMILSMHHNCGGVGQRIAAVRQRRDVRRRKDNAVVADVCRRQDFVQRRDCFLLNRTCPALFRQVA